MSSITLLMFMLSTVMMKSSYSSRLREEYSNTDSLVLVMFSTDKGAHMSKVWDYEKFKHVARTAAAEGKLSERIFSGKGSERP